MYTFESRDLTTAGERLLFSILLELKKLNADKPTPMVNDSVVNIKPTNDILFPYIESNWKTKQNKICLYCGKSHERPVDYAICAKKHKKKEGDIK